MKKEKIEMKNYVIFGFVCVVSVFLVWYCASWYRTTEEYRVETSPIVEMISEIHMDEVSNYILDNRNITIYVTSFAAEPNMEFEKELKKLILKHELNDTIVVLDRDKITNDQFFQSLADQFLSEELKQKNISLGYVPNLLVFENGKIVDVYNTNNQITSYDKLEEFVLKHQEMEE